MPMLCDSADMPLQSRMIHQHYFLGGSDWYIAEYSPDSRIFFGYAILSNDRQNSEWGYLSLGEMMDIKTPQGFEIDRDLHWEPKKAYDIPKISEASGW